MTLNKPKVAEAPFTPTHLTFHAEVPIPPVQRMEQAKDADGNLLFLDADGEDTTDNRRATGFEEEQYVIDYDSDTGNPNYGTRQRPTAYEANEPKMVEAGRTMEDGTFLPSNVGESVSISIRLVGANGVPAGNATGDADSISVETLAGLKQLLGKELPALIKAATS